jgi:hypothetical protein
VLLSRPEDFMISANPKDSRNMATLVTELMQSPNFPKQVEEPSKNGPTVDSGIRVVPTMTRRVGTLII